MTDYDTDYGADTGDENKSGSGKGLRAQLEEALAARAQLEKELKEFREQTNASAVAAAWDGVPEHVKKIYKGPEDPKEITAWLEDAKTVVPFELPENEEDNVDPEEKAAIKRQQDTRAGGKDPKSGASQLSELEELVKTAKPGSRGGSSALDAALGKMFG